MEYQHSEKKVDCRDCEYFTVHPSYPYMVICLEKQQLVSLPRQVCKDFVERTWQKLVDTLSERGFLYCAICNKPIYNIDELTRHRREFIPYESIPDDVAFEEAPAAD
ncbi:MAG: hypothetical protein ABDH32_04770 [Candidatus Caldarchaeales archaeon]